MTLNLVTSPQLFLPISHVSCALIAERCLINFGIIFLIAMIIFLGVLLIIILLIIIVIIFIVIIMMMMMMMMIIIIKIIKVKNKFKK